MGRGTRKIKLLLHFQVEFLYFLGLFFLGGAGGEGGRIPYDAFIKTKNSGPTDTEVELIFHHRMTAVESELNSLAGGGASGGFKPRDFIRMAGAHTPHHPSVATASNTCRPLCRAPPIPSGVGRTTVLTHAIAMHSNTLQRQTKHREHRKPRFGSLQGKNGMRRTSNRR